MTTNPSAPKILGKLKPFFKKARYKVCYGGRGAGRSWGVAKLLILRAMSGKEKILCAREFQRSIDASVLALLSNQIDLMGYTSAFDVQKQKITCKLTGSEFIFAGIAQNVQSIKSIEGITICWVEEAEKVSQNSWEVLIPSIRGEDSEIWITLNPAFDLDPTYTQFILTPPKDSVVVQANYSDNKWFPDVLEKERVHMLATNPEAYENVWLGKAKASRPGAFYAKQMDEMISEGRITRVPYDKNLPVYRSWDLEIADQTVVLFWQVPFSLDEVRLIDTFSCIRTSLPDVITQIEKKPYKRIAMDIFPHDLKVKEFGSGSTRMEIAQELGLDVTLAPNIPVADGIDKVKIMLNQVWIDQDNNVDTIKALKLYHSEFDEAKQVFALKPVHDVHSDFMDAFRYFAVTQVMDYDARWHRPIDYSKATLRVV